MITFSAYAAFRVQAIIVANFCTVCTSNEFMTARYILAKTLAFKVTEKIMNLKTGITTKVSSFSSCW